MTASLSFSAWRLRAVRPEVEFGCLWAAFCLLAGAEQQLWEKRIKCSVYAETIIFSAGGGSSFIRPFLSQLLTYYFQILVCPAEENCSYQEQGCGQQETENSDQPDRGVMIFQDIIDV